MSFLRKIIRFLPSAILLATILFSFLDRGGIPFLSHAVFIVALFGIVFLLLFRKREQPAEITETTLVFLAFVIFFIVSLFLSKTPNYGLTEFFSVAGGFFVFMFFAARIFSKEDFKIFHWGGLGLLILALIIGIYAFVFLPFDRFNGPFLNFSKLYEAYPNNMASFLLVYLPFLFYFFFSTRGKWKYFYGTLLVFSLSAFFLTSSRSAFLGFLGACVLAALFWIIFYRPKFNVPRVMKNAGVLLIIFIASAILTAGLMFSRSQYQLLLNLHDRIDIESYEGGSGVKERLEFWQGSIIMAKEHLQHGEWFGNGPGSFQFFFPRYQKTFGIIQDQPHNYFLVLLVENGIFTVLSFLLLLILLCIQTLRWLKRNNNPFIWTVVFSVTSLVLAKSVDDNFSFVSVGIPFFGMLGFLANTSAEYSIWKFSISTKKILAALFVFSISFAFLAAHEIYYNIPFKQGKELVAQGEIFILAGIEKLEQAKKLFWERDLFIHRSNAYKTLFWNTKKPSIQKQDILEKWEALIKEICDPRQKNAFCGFMPEFYISIGSFLNTSNQYKLAQYFYDQPFELDPINNLEYYFLSQKFFESLEAGSKMRSQILDFLRQYTDLLQKNAHFTLTTKSPYYADLIYGRIISDTVDQSEAQKLFYERQQFRKIWVEQQKQFERRYELAPSQFHQPSCLYEESIYGKLAYCD